MGFLGNYKTFSNFRKMSGNGRFTPTRVVVCVENVLTENRSYTDYQIMDFNEYAPYRVQSSESPFAYSVLEEKSVSGQTQIIYTQYACGTESAAADGYIYEDYRIKPVKSEANKVRFKIKLESEGYTGTAYKVKVNGTEVYQSAYTSGDDWVQNDILIEEQDAATVSIGVPSGFIGSVAVTEFDVLRDYEYLYSGSLSELAAKKAEIESLLSAAEISGEEIAFLRENIRRLENQIEAISSELDKAVENKKDSILTIGCSSTAEILGGAFGIVIIFAAVLCLRLRNKR